MKKLFTLTLLLYIISTSVSAGNNFQLNISSHGFYQLLSYKVSQKNKIISKGVIGNGVTVQVYGDPDQDDTTVDIELGEDPIDLLCTTRITYTKDFQFISDTTFVRNALSINAQPGLQKVSIYYH